YSAILLKKADPSRDIRVLERNGPQDTFGFGVVFSDATLEGFRAEDAESMSAIDEAFHHWDDIDVHYGGRVIKSVGHGFAGLGRTRLLDLLQRRAASLGIPIEFHQDVGLDDPRVRSADLVIASDGVNSALRKSLENELGVTIEQRPNHFVWLGTDKQFPAFTFYFKQNKHGLFRVHAYQYLNTPIGPGEARSTFIVECTDETWRAAGLDRASEAETLEYCKRLFAEELGGAQLIANRSLWRSFPRIELKKWSHGNVVFLGDAAHTAHFSIGSGTKLAMEDSIALRDAFATTSDVAVALASYDANRRPAVEAVQRAADVSMRWFEETERYFGRLEPLPFVVSMLTRSLRISHENLRVRDRTLVEAIDAFVADKASKQSGVTVSATTPPMFTPLKLRELVLDNRIVVSPMCQYSAVDGAPNDWHVVHYGSRAIGGAGLVMCEMTNVSADARITPGCTGLYRDDHVAAWKRIVDFVHGHSRAKIGVQLGHAGRKGATKLMWEGMDQPLTAGQWPLISPSELPYFPGKSQCPKAMDRADMDRVKADYIAATSRAQAAGFDLLELHLAHGYLLATFLSPLTNHRVDEYGGSLEARLRYPLEIVDAMRTAWPAHRPLSARISATDWVDGGLDAADAVAIARALEAHGVDIVDVSTGQTTPASKPRFGRLYQTPFSDQIKHEARLRTMTVGNVSSWSDANAIIAAERADLVLLGRGHLYDPYWTRHAAQEQGYAMPWPNQYQLAQTFTPRA
ncbi:MAG: FAD-dependent monooxygenase, partial [Polyangiales bacterium]